MSRRFPALARAAGKASVASRGFRPALSQSSSGARQPAGGAQRRFRWRAKLPGRPRAALARLRRRPGDLRRQFCFA
eukprot:1032830-Pyramimonas_sp.AAC.1